MCKTALNKMIDKYSYYKDLALYNLVKIVLSILCLSLLTQTASADEIHKVDYITRMDIHSPINPATLDYLKYVKKKSSEQNADLILISLNTPGGLVTTTKDILALIGESDIPVVIWITPEGASATSAGAIIASSAHVLVMSEGTNIGAATPIQMSGDIEQKDLRNKAVNDLVALVQSLSESRGRNPKHYADMIEKASSFKSREAVELGLVDGIINNEAELFKFLENREITIRGVKTKLQVDRPNIEKIRMTAGQELLNIFANPTLAYLLLLAGAALIYLEFQAPGGFIAGSAGVICLMIAGISFQVLPLNMGALGLILLGFVFFVAEIYITSFGVISIMGLAALATGSIFLFQGQEGHLEINPYVIASVIVAVALFLVFVANVFLKGGKKIGKVKFNATTGKEGVVVEVYEKADDSLWPYQIRVNAENWRAVSDETLTLHDKVIVLEENQETMSLKVKKL
jgi:membrane-bound serine protease (ClpP class)